MFANHEVRHAICRGDMSRRLDGIAEEERSRPSGGATTAPADAPDRPDHPPSTAAACAQAVPLSPATQGLTVGIISYDGTVCFGLLADRDLQPPVAVAVAGLRAALAELSG